LRSGSSSGIRQLPRACNLSSLDASYSLKAPDTLFREDTMRGLTILVATILTVGYGFAAQAAMTVDRAETIRRVAGSTETAAPTRVEAATRVWYGGMLLP